MARRGSIRALQVVVSHNGFNIGRNLRQTVTTDRQHMIAMFQDEFVKGDTCAPRAQALRNIHPYQTFFRRKPPG